MSDKTKLSNVDDVREEFAQNPKRALLVMGMRVEKDAQHVDIVFQRGILESLNLAGQACVLEALQQAAEYVSSVMAAESGSSGTLS